MEKVNKSSNNALEQNRINYKELQKIAPDFSQWIKDYVRYGNVDSQVIISLNEDKKSFSCKLFTQDNKYSISGTLPTNNSQGYLGCIYTQRKPRVGEDWVRGNDLPDGVYNKDTFLKIMRSIIKTELKTIQL